MNTWYIKDNGTVGWSGVTKWAANHTYAAGSFVRQLAAPAAGNERCFVCTVGGQSGGSESGWTLTRGGSTIDNAVTWRECTGLPGPNGDSTNTVAWAASVARSLGDVIKNVSGGADTYFICTTAGTSKSGAEPTWNKTAGQTTADGTATWTSIGAISGFSTAFAYPHARLGNAIATNWGADGDTFYLSNNHAETQSTSMTLAMRGSGSSPSNYICVTDTAAPPTAAATTATIKTTGNSPINIGNYQGVLYMYGIGFTSGSGASGAAHLIIAPIVGFFESCGFNQGSTNADQMYLGDGNLKTYKVVAQNCTFTFGNTTQSLIPYVGFVDIIGGSIALTGSAPTPLLSMPSTYIGGVLTVRDCDLSAITGTLMEFHTGGITIYIENCKLGAGVTLVDTSNLVDQSGCLAHIHNADSGSKNYRFYTANYSGTSQQDTTTVRTGGATDGTTAISWNLTPSANVSFGLPFQSEEIMQWNDTTGSSKTATVEIAGANTLTNADIWMEIEYPGNASYPLGSTANSRASSILATPTNVTSSSASWGGSPAHTQKLQVTFTPQMKGPIKARIYVAKPSITVYVDPLITVA
jgi:hypothetical protein